MTTESALVEVREGHGTAAPRGVDLWADNQEFCLLYTPASVTQVLEAYRGIGTVRSLVDLRADARMEVVTECQAVAVLRLAGATQTLIIRHALHHDMRGADFDRVRLARTLERPVVSVGLEDTSGATRYLRAGPEGSVEHIEWTFDGVMYFDASADALGQPSRVETLAEDDEIDPVDALSRRVEQDDAHFPLCEVGQESGAYQLLLHDFAADRLAEAWLILERPRGRDGAPLA